MAAEPAVLFPDLEGHWYPVRDTDPRLYLLYSRHYSTQHLADSPSRRALKSGGQIPSIAPFGDYVALLTGDCSAGFLWVRAPGGVWQSGTEGVSCAFFRNEGPTRSSDLILEAMDIAWKRWPGERLFTYVWDAKVASVNPGACYRHAGWTPCGRNADGRLTILERLPLDGNPSSPNASGYCTAHRGAECSRCRSSRLEREGSHGLAASR
jgi:hypothetical protein